LVLDLPLQLPSLFQLLLLLEVSTGGNPGPASSMLPNTLLWQRLCLLHPSSRSSGTGGVCACCCRHMWRLRAK
jgi:hypothetical protein